MLRLGVNIDHVATLRQARGEPYPDPVQAALLAELGGADNITCHLREDRRHIQDRDVRLLKDTIKVPLNFEMAVTAEMLAFAAQIKPHAVTLVPEKREELTTEGGLAVDRMQAVLTPAIARLKELGILVSLFVEADPRVLDACQRLHADAIEIHTGDFCRQMAQAVTTKQQLALLAPLARAAQHASDLGLQVHFGHGLHYQNAAWLQLIPSAEEANIGHAIMARALFVGLTPAVASMKELLNHPQHRPLAATYGSH